MVSDLDTIEGGTRLAPAGPCANSLLEAIYYGHVTGYDLGKMHGRRERAEEIVQEILSARAGRVATTIASYPERDHEADRRAAERSEQWWSARRGGGHK